METILLAAGLALGYIAFIVAIEVIRRVFKTSAEITRRIVHIVSGLATLVNFWLLPSPHLLTLIVISLVVVILSHRFGWLTSVHSVKRKTYGDIFLPLGTLSTWAISQGDPKIFIPSILIMTFADSAAGLVSEFYKEPRKMFRGSILFLVIAAAILLSTGNFSVLSCLIFAVLLTLIERYSPLGSDNLTVPVAAALLLLFLKF